MARPIQVVGQGVREAIRPGISTIELLAGVKINETVEWIEKDGGKSVLRTGKVLRVQPVELVPGQPKVAKITCRDLGQVDVVRNWYAPLALPTIKSDTVPATAQ